MTTLAEKYCPFPVRAHDLWAFYKAAESTFWIPEEVDLSQDWTQWQTKLDEGTKSFILWILAFFAAIDGIIMKNIQVNLSEDTELFAAKAFYAAQAHIEVVHAQVYGLFIEKLVPDEQQKNFLFEAIETVPEIKAKADFAFEHMQAGKHSYAKRLLVFVILEGLFFSGAFCSIFWLKSQGLMPGLAQSNTLIARDEGLHTDFGVCMYNNYLDERLDEEEVQEIMQQAVDIEKRFIRKALERRLVGMNADLMTQYIEFVADRLLKSLNCAPVFKTKNPFPFMEQLGLETKVNFFEHRVTEYSRLHNEGDENDEEW